MAIQYNEKKRIFSLHTAHTTYQMMADSHDYLLHLYYGKHAVGEMDYLLQYMDRGFSPCPHETAPERIYSLDVLPQELPTVGTGDYRVPALMIESEGGIIWTDLRYAGYRITSGKYSLPGLPAVYASAKEAQTLEIFLRDQALGLQVSLLYGVLPELDIITRAMILKNTGSEKLYVRKAQSAVLDFVSGEFDLLTFLGRHTFERSMTRSHVSGNCQTIGSRRGMSSHQFNPLMILSDRTTNETEGRCWAMEFVYSGGFKGEVMKDQFGGCRMQLGLSDELFRYPLAPGDCFASPEVILSYSHKGFSALSQSLHRCIRSHVCRGPWKDKVRPVLVNSWEAAYFHFNGETIYQLAKSAKELGIEMVVMDDGWFTNRSDDYSGLGDWTVDEEKLGESLGSLISRINAIGMKFGIWVEPEMISEISELYKAHPDWALSIPGRDPVLGRSQLVLDMSRKEVVDYIFERLCSLLDQGNIEYIKWDYNRCIAEVYSHCADEQGRVLYDYMLGLYDLLERLIVRYPDLLIEGCAGGGGRFDAGMLYYTPQIWCSDNTDAIDRLQIQYGTSFGYPAAAMGAHVSVCPNHQNGRITPFHTRAVVAMSGTFGYELDPAKLTEEEKNQVKDQVALFHKLAPLIQNGRYYRLTNPAENLCAAWEIVSDDRSRVLLNVVIQDVHGNMPIPYIRLQGLESGRMYHEETLGITYSSDALMDAGMPVPIQDGVYHAFQLIFTRLES
ncbi:MAG: alpha-galactosidase [Lachnospiraceae bacterium]|nr:alpha-galactosidase [Lachnospiraceae bacterium]